MRRALNVALWAAWLAGWQGGGAAAQTVRELTVDESVRLGLEHNARVRAARADAEVARAGERQVRAARLPALRSQASYARLSSNIPAVEFTLPGYDSAFTFQGVELDRVQTELSLEVPLLAQLRLGHETRAATHDAAAAALALEQERADVAFEIRRAYWTLYRALELRDAVEAARASVEAHLRLVRARGEEGSVLARDILAAETRRSEVLLQRVEADNAVRVGELELHRLVGLPLGEPLRLLSTPTEENAAAGSTEPAEAAGAGGGDRRPRLAALERHVLGLRERLDAAGRSRLPDVDFYARWLYAKPNPYFFAEPDRFHGTWELGLAGRWAIWEGGRNSAREEEARARLEAAEARLRAASEEAAVQTARLRLEAQRAAEAVEVAEQNVRHAEESFRVVERQFEEGAALSTDVLEAEAALRRARAGRAEAVADRAIARAALLNALGRVW